MEASVRPLLARFGVFEVDLRAGELRKGGLKVRLQDKPFRLLSALLERRGEVVTREELRSRLWPADTFVDFDNSLNNAVNKVRVALGDTAENPRFVETVGRRGYRFVAPVEFVRSAAEPADEPSPAQVESRPRRRRIHPWILGAVGALVVLAVGGLIVRQRVGPAAPAPLRSVAVLPLINDSAGPTEEYFADGMTDALITELARARTLRVISRTSVMQYRRSTKRLPEIAAELGVDGVIEGSVLRSGDRVRITAQLVDGRTDTHLWAETYNGAVRDVLALQADVARAIARAVNAELTLPGAPRPPRTVDPAAFDLYLRGRSACTMRETPETVRQGIDYLRQAIARDAEYAQAHTALAQCYTAMGTLFLAQPPALTRPMAIAAAQEAIRLDDRLAEAHRILAIMDTREWRWARAEAAFRRALDLSPNDSATHTSYATYLATQRRTGESLAEAQLAEELDPLSLATRTNAGWMLQLAGRHEEAIRKLQSVLAADPLYTHARWLMCISYSELRRYDEANACFAAAEKLADTPAIAGWRAHALALGGRREEARRLVDGLVARAQSGYVPPFPVAVAYAGLGDRDRAFEWLERGFAERSTPMPFVGYRYTQLLGDDPRLADLVRRMGLTPGPLSPSTR